MAVTIRRLDHELVQVTGPERLSWLQGQVTNDVARTKVGDSVYALVLDVRGKIHADVSIYHRESDLVFAAPPGARAALMKHLDRFIVMEDVDLAALPDHTIVTIQGVSEPVGDLGYPVFRSDRLGEGGIDVLVPVDEADAAVARWSERLGAEVLDEDSWETRRILAARPRFEQDFGPDTYAQEAGLKHAAVSFVKGCYLGQEVVCMLENRGALRRRLVQLQGPSATVSGELRDGDKVVGTLTSVAQDPDGGIVALGFVKIATSEVGTELLHDGNRLTIRAIVGEPAGESEHAAL